MADVLVTEDFGPEYEKDDVDNYDPEETTPKILDDSSLPELSGAGLPSLRVRANVELLRGAVDTYYNTLEKEQGVVVKGRDYPNLGSDDKIHLKKFPKVSLVNIRDGKPLAFNTIYSRLSGISKSDLQNLLGYSHDTKIRLRHQEALALLGTDRGLGDAAAAAESVPLQDMGGVATDAIDSVQTMETRFTEGGIDDSGGFPLRELRGLNQALQRIRGELVNNLAKLTELDRNIALEREKLTELGGDETELRRRKTAQLNDLMIERSARLEAASTNREDLRSQISRVRETIHRVLNEDTTLGDRLRTLLREQGITIASILTAVGMTISTLVLTLTGGGSSGMPAPTPTPPDKGGLREWAKKKLQDLGRLLARLAGKAAAALPGIIGSIVSWLLNTLGKTATWLAGNLWVMILAIAGLILMSAREWLLVAGASSPTKKPKRQKA